MSKIDAMIAPHALTSNEIVSVITPHIIAYAVAHRAYIMTGTLSDGSCHDAATTHACEEALACVVDSALASLDEWLRDMERDGSPRFYRKVALRDAVQKICRAAAAWACEYQLWAEVDAFLGLLTDRDAVMTEGLISRAGE